MSEQEQSIVLAALLWDVPQLARSQQPGAAAFMDRLRPPPHHREIEEGEAPLLIAARGLRHEFEQRPEEAVTEYRKLLGGDGWIGVLGGFLLCWSEAAGDPNWVESIAAATRNAEFDHPYLRARLLGTVAVHALDHGLGELFGSLLSEAADTAPVGSSLRRALRISQSNWLDFQLSPEDWQFTDEDDPLVDYDWIDSYALTGAQEAIVAQLKSRSASPWSWTIGGGRTPIDSLIAAERQVTWAGALWKRNPIRQQLAAQILNDPNRDAYFTLYALANWLLSRGRDIAQVLSYAEPAFDSTSADKLIQTLEGQVAVPHVRDTALPDSAAEMWDLLSPDATDRLLTRYRPSATDNPFEESVRRFWGLASVSAPKLWRRHFDALDPEQQVALLGTLPVHTLNALPKTVARRLISAVNRAPSPLSLYAQAATLLLRHKVGGDASLKGEDPGAAVAAEIALRAPAALGPAEYARAEAALRVRGAEEINAARQGTVSFGGRSSLRDLSLVAQARGSVDRKTLNLLMKVALDASLPGEKRLDALLALTGLSTVGLLSGPRLKKLHDAPDDLPPSFFGNVSQDLLRSARFAVRARQLDEAEQIELFTLSRNPDARVRQFTCEAAGRFLERRRSSPVEAALLAGLFDPEERVLSAALGALQVARLTKLSQDAVTERLTRLYENYGRTVRSQAVRAAKKSLQQRPADARLERIVASGAMDRSWLVRDSANESVASE